MPAYSVVIPSRGDRPLALGMALDSIRLSWEKSQMVFHNLEILVGFDGICGERVRDFPEVKYFDLPSNKDFGNALRHALLKASTGDRIVFVDDDNVLTEQAFSIYELHKDVELLVARIDVSRAHPVPFLPVHQEGKPIVRPCHI